MSHILRLLNQAGVGRYEAGGFFVEALPNADGPLGVAGIELRHAVAELTWKPKDREMQAAFDRKLTLWHAAVAERQRRGFSVERQGGMRCHDQYQSSVCVGVNYHISPPSRIGSSVVRTLMLRSCLGGS